MLCTLNATHTEYVGEYIYFTFWTFVCVDRDLCWTLMKVEIDFTFRARCVFPDVGLRHSSNKLSIIALMHAVVQISPRWLELRWREMSFINVFLLSWVLTFNCKGEAKTTPSVNTQTSSNKCLFLLLQFLWLVMLLEFSFSWHLHIYLFQHPSHFFHHITAVGHYLRLLWRSSRPHRRWGSFSSCRHRRTFALHGETSRWGELHMKHSQGAWVLQQHRTGSPRAADHLYSSDWP